MNIKLYLFFLVIPLLSCRSEIQRNTPKEHPDIHIVKQFIIDKTRRVIFTSSDTSDLSGKIRVSYCYPRLVKENDTILIDSTCGFEHCELSADKQYILLSKREFVQIDTNPNNSVHEFSFCLKVSANDGTIVLAERNCYGQWPRETVIKKD